jgi:hypothetical protein
MKVLKGALAAAAIVSLVACEQPGVTQAPKEQNGESTSASPKKPLEFDVSKILYPPADPGYNLNPALAKSAATYYTFPLSSPSTLDDYNYLCQLGCGNINSVVEATYSGRFTAYPENLWYITHGLRLTAGPITDNEQTEIHFFIPTGTGTPGGFNTRYVTLSYEVNTEANYDKVYINSTASNGSCNSPGVVRSVLSGYTQGTATFSVPGNCGQIWVGVYYIKDISLTAPGEVVNIRNFSVTY